MTTPEAAQRYLWSHLQSVNGKLPVVYNPNNKPVEELPFIYGFNNGGARDWYEALSISADGHILGQHICSHELYMPSDLDIIHPDGRRHEAYKKHYPEGYRCDFIPFDSVSEHEGLQEAFKLLKVNYKPVDESQMAKVEIEMASTEKPTE